MQDEDRAKDDDPERDKKRRPNRRVNSGRAAVIFTHLVQVVTLIGQISDLFR